LSVVKIGQVLKSPRTYLLNAYSQCVLFIVCCENRTSA